MQKKIIDFLVDLLFRGVIGLVLIYALSVFCQRWGMPVLVGINPLSFLIVAFLGAPGMLLLYVTGLIGLL